jgi:hypothetical protein
MAYWRIVTLALIFMASPPAIAQGGFSDFLKSLGELGKALGELGGALSGNPSNPNAVNPADFGVQGQWLDANNAQRLRFPREYYGIGYIVSEVTPGGPAAKTGLQPDDVVTHFGNTPLSQQTESQLQSQVLSGRPIAIKLFRNGQFYDTYITPEPDSAGRSQQTATASNPIIGTAPAGMSPGISSGAERKMTLGVRGGGWINAENAQRLRYPKEYSGFGLIVGEVMPGGPAAKAGIQRDDVLTYFGNTPLSQQTSSQWIAQIESGRPIPIKLFRNGQFYDTYITPEPDSAGRPMQSIQTSNPTTGAQVAGTPPGSVNPGSCRQGAALEARDYTQPEILGRPSGERAQMCFYRLVGSGAEYLNFFSTGHFYHTSISGSGGFAMSGAIYGTVRGTYGFQPNGVLSTRIGYQGTGVSQTNSGAGTERTMDVTGQTRMQNEMTLSNCQKITYRDEVKRVQYDRTSSHPGFMVVDGVRWERYSMECPAWRGWN